ncbi:MAG TPA: acyl-CoA dehydrogenase family protein, partial [Acidimicrobiales bacterium]|nr:acyl-CoA dehydrogenase family protein [Acidimicrobiales bacterium]
MDFDLTPEQQDLVHRSVSAGNEWRPFAEQWDHDNYAPINEVTARMGELGFLGMTMPVEYGGQGKSNVEYALAVEQLVRTSTTWVAAEPLFRTSGAGPAICLLSSNAIAREKFLPAITSGRAGCTIGITEPEHGSDMTSLETTATRGDRGSWIISGEKRFITGAVEDTYYATFVRFDGIPGAKGVGAIMTEKDTPGFTMDRGPDFVGSRGVPHGNLRFDECRVPAENLLFGPGEFGQLMTAFNMERMHNAASSLGSAWAAFDLALEYAQVRRQFDREIIEFQAIYHDFADMYVQLEAARSLMFKAATSSAGGTFPNALDVTAAKYFANQVMYDVSARAVTIFGGEGTTMDNPAQRIHRDSLICRIAGGAPQVIRNTIASQLLPHRRFSQRR